MQKHPVCYRKNIGGEWIRYKSPPGIAMYLRRALLRINNAYRNHMNRTFDTPRVVLTVWVLSTLLVCVAFAYQTSLIPSSRLISPDELARILQSSKGEKPLMIQVGSHVLYS